jgi:hypothetical protein
MIMDEAVQPAFEQQPIIMHGVLTGLSVDGDLTARQTLTQSN